MKPLIEHLDELRSRLITVLISLAIFFVTGISLARFVIEQLRNDLIVYPGVQLIVLTPLEYIITRIKVGMFIGIILAVPVFLYQAYLFVRPGLKRNESEAMQLFLPLFLVLFTAGLVFAYFMFIPVVLYFLASFSVKLGIPNLWSLNRFVLFVFLTVLGMGFLFQLPLLIIVASRFGLISAEWLKSQRKYVYVIILILAAIITPPDIITQVIIALPVVLLYELSLILLKIIS